MIATPDRTPLPGELFDRPARGAGDRGGPNGPGPRRDVMSGAPGQVYAHFTHDVPRRSA